MGVGDQGHSGRRDKLKEPLEKQPGPTTTTTPQQGLQSSGGVELEGKAEMALLLDANRNQETLSQREKRMTWVEDKLKGRLGK